MKMILETRADDKDATKWVETTKYPNTSTAKSNYETLQPSKEGMYIREHLCDHDEPDGSEFKRGCKVNVKKMVSGKVVTVQDSLAKYFEQFDDVEKDESGKTERQKEVEKIDSNLTEKYAI